MTLTQAQKLEDTESVNSSEVASDCHLLNLPGELRNRIYREVLVEAGDIEFYSADPADQYEERTIFQEHNTVEPGLLRCNKQIRNEARPIFLEENDFEMTIQNGKLEPQLGHWFWRHDKARMGVSHTGGVIWENLKVWLAAYWRGDISHKRFKDVFSFHAGLDDDSDYRQAMRAFEMTTLMMSMRWETIEQVLDHYADGLASAGRYGYGFD